VGWIDLVQDRNKYRAVVNKAMKYDEFIDLMRSSELRSSELLRSH